MNFNIIPLTADPDQTFTCTVPVGAYNKKFFFRMRYNSMAEYWTMTLTDAVSGIVLIDSHPLLVTNYPSSNLLGQFEYLGIGSALVLNVSGVRGSMPAEFDLGTDYLLLWGDNGG